MLASRVGFSAEARAVARVRGIDLWALRNWNVSGPNKSRTDWETAFQSVIDARGSPIDCPLRPQHDSLARSRVVARKALWQSLSDPVQCGEATDLIILGFGCLELQAF